MIRNCSTKPTLTSDSIISALSNAVSYAKFSNHSHDAVIRVSEAAGNLIPQFNRRESHTPPHKEGTFPPRWYISGGRLWSARIVFAFLSESSAKDDRRSDTTVDLCD